MQLELNILNKGDIVVCIDKCDTFDITIGKQYTVLYDVDIKNDLIHVKLDSSNESAPFLQRRFLKIEDWRELQINKILK